MLDVRDVRRERQNDFFQFYSFSLKKISLHFPNVVSCLRDWFFFSFVSFGIFQSDDFSFHIKTLQILTCFVKKWETKKKQKKPFIRCESDHFPAFERNNEANFFLLKKMVIFVMCFILNV